MEVTMKVSLHLYAPQLQGKAIKLIKGFWKEHLQGKPYHISALYKVDLEVGGEDGLG